MSHNALSYRRSSAFLNFSLEAFNVLPLFRTAITGLTIHNLSNKTCKTQDRHDRKRHELHERWNLRPLELRKSSTASDGLGQKAESVSEEPKKFGPKGIFQHVPSFFGGVYIVCGIIVVHTLCIHMYPIHISIFLYPHIYIIC